MAIDSTWSDHHAGGTSTHHRLVHQDEREQGLVQQADPDNLSPTAIPYPDKDPASCDRVRMLKGNEWPVPAQRCALINKDWTGLEKTQ